MEVGIFMAKYSYEYKKKIVMEYLNNKGSYKTLANKYGVKSHENIIKWVKCYKEFGEEGLLRSRKNEKYTFEYKLSVVELYLTTEVSYQELALRVGINNPSIINRWVNDYHIAGPEALQEKRKGRPTKMSKLNNKIKTPDNNTVTNTDYLKQLEQENLKLRIENAYLKELRRLRFEKESLNEKRELSVASEENSN